ncbi:MAG: histidine triad nucleotide-binding protein [bacterium]|nr:histidine triad nucleotide-binding protein [bacterium]
MSTDCIFCQIASGAVPTDKVFEDDQVVVFKDLNPQAPIHLLVIPKKHITTLEFAEPEDAALLGKLVYTAKEVAQEQGLEAAGYRLVMNVGEQAGQTVMHIHLHILAGRELRWPPG